MSKREVVHTIHLDKSLKIILTIAAVGIVLIGARPVFQAVPAWAELDSSDTLYITHSGSIDVDLD